jgi:hypothetical protein
VRQEADLLLPRVDPRTEIGNTRMIEAIVLRGRFLARREIDGLLGKIQAARGERSPVGAAMN